MGFLQTQALPILFKFEQGFGVATKPRAPGCHCQRIPPAWHHIARNKGRDKKIKITIGVEAGLVRFFKSMGTGYQNRMNDVMSAWVHARLAGLIEGAETMDAFRHTEYEGTPKPDWGVTEEAWRDIRGE